MMRCRRHRANVRPGPPAGGGRRAPGLPVGLVLLGLAALGLVPASLSYARASTRGGALARTDGRSAQSPSYGLARPAWPARDDVLAASDKEGER